VLIAFIGPDGCGKTTVAVAVVDHLTQKGIDVRFFEMNFGVLPRFRDIAATFLRRPTGRSHLPGEHMAGMRHRPNAPFRGVVYMLWYTLDYVLGGIRYRRQIRTGAVVFARYLYDYGYQRSYSRVPQVFHKMMIRLAPAPDFVFTIDRDSGDIFRGKPELTVEEIRRQQDNIRRMLAGKAHFHILDGNRGVTETIACAVAIIEGALRS
jgi:thymidylate kinase